MSNAPGDRNRDVMVQTLTETEPGGVPVDTFVDGFRVWCHRRSRGGDEAFRADELGARVDDEWTCPYRADLDPELVDVTKERRLLYGGRIFDIVQAELSARRDYITLRTIARGAVPA